MRKHLLSLLCSLSVSASLFGQQYILQYASGGTGVTGATNSNIYQDANGNIGIGNTGPTGALDVTLGSGTVTGIIQADYYSANTTVVRNMEGANYFVASHIPRYLPFPPGSGGYTYGTPITDFNINNVGQIAVGTGPASSNVDVLIQNHGYNSSGDVFNPAIAALDDGGNLLFVGTNVGTSTVPAGAIMIGSNSQYAYGNPNIALLVVDQNGTTPLNGPILGVAGNGVVTIGNNNPVAQFDIEKNNNDVDYLLHVSNADENGDIFTVSNNGNVTVGGLPSGNGMFEISDNGGSAFSGLPLFLVNNGGTATPAVLSLFA